MDRFKTGWGMKEDKMDGKRMKKEKSWLRNERRKAEWGMKEKTIDEQIKEKAMDEK